MTVLEAAASDAAGGNLGAVAEEAPRKRRRWLPKFVLALPSWFWYLSFFVVPLVLVIINSFGAKVQGSAGAVDLSNPSLDRYRDALNGTYFDVLSKTLRISLIGTALCLIIGFPMAYWLAVRVPQRWRGVLLGLVIIPFWTNFLVRTYAWMFILRTEGLLNTLLLKLGLIATPIELLYSNTAVVIGLVYGYLPFMVLPLYAALERVDRTLIEAAWDLYATRWAVFWRIIFPLARPGVMAGCLLVFIPSLGAFLTPDLLGGARSMMIGNLIQHEFLVARDWPLGAAISCVLMLLVVGMMGWSLRAAKTLPQREDES